MDPRTVPPTRSLGRTRPGRWNAERTTASGRNCLTPETDSDAERDTSPAPPTTHRGPAANRPEPMSELDGRVALITEVANRRWGPNWSLQTRSDVDGDREVSAVRSRGSSPRGHQEYDRLRFVRSEIHLERVRIVNNEVKTKTVKTIELTR